MRRRLHSMRTIRLTRAMLLVCLLSWNRDSSMACAVPVFQNALDQWPSGSYRVTVFHKGPLSTEQQAVVDALRKTADKAVANLDVTNVDVSRRTCISSNEPTLAQPPKQLPWMIVETPDPRAVRRIIRPGRMGPGPGAPMGFPAQPEGKPEAGQARRTVWSGSVTADNYVRLLDSPARRELTRRILAGDSVVWLLLESGDQGLDATVNSLLQTESPKVQATLASEAARPTGPPGSPGDLRDSARRSAKIALSILRVSRTDPAEELFIAQLLRAGEDFTQAKGPIVFPIFGRCRVLTGITGPDLNPQSIANVASFLCGDCSCVVKDRQPGTELLVAADWSSVTNGSGRMRGGMNVPPELPVLAALLPPPVPANSQSAVPSSLADYSPSGLMRSLVSAACVVLLIVVAGGVVMMRRNPDG
jgi:hypothetical protein